MKVRSWEQASFKIGFGTDPTDLNKVECILALVKDVGVGENERMMA